MGNHRGSLWYEAGKTPPATKRSRGWRKDTWWCHLEFPRPPCRSCTRCNVYSRPRDSDGQNYLKALDADQKEHTAVDLIQLFIIKLLCF